VPPGFSPLRAEDPVEEVSTALLLLDSIGTKMLKLEEVDGGQLEAEGRALAKAVVEYVLTCIWSRDPQISLEPVVQGPVAETAEAARASVEDTVKLVAERFECQPEDAYGSTSTCSCQGFLLLVNKLVIASVELCLP
jgi:hypothetical protein